MSGAAGTPLGQALCRAAAFPYPLRAPPRLVETHISWVLIGDDFAYKVKKPVNPGFLDFTSLAARERYCRDELRLNRRLNPDLYLDVVPVTAGPDGPRFEGDGEAIDWAVKMRTFAADARLDVMLEAGRLDGAEFEALGADIARLHAAAPVAGAETPWGEPGLVIAHAMDNFASLAGQAPPAELGALEADCRNLAERRRADFAARKAAGRVRECHGDLHLSNLIMTPGGIRPFDCLEFDPELRWIDVAADIAFLLMDLDVRERRAFATLLLNAWLAAGGDYDALRVLRWYLGYRTLVRAKVAALQIAQGLEVAANRDRCRRHLALATRYLSPASPRLVITCGLSGSGKSWLARRLAVAANAVWVRSDVERKRLAGLAPLAPSDSPVDGGLYSEAASQRTYTRLGECARAALDGGFTVVVDATFLEAAQRATFVDLGAGFGAPCRIVYCEAPEAVLRERVRARRAGGQDPSEADERVLDAQLARFTPPDPRTEPVIRFDGGEQRLSALLDELAAARPP